jgi:uncharacterized protein (DUF2141 family)
MNLILSLLISMLFSFIPGQNTSEIDLHIHDAKTNKGVVRILLFDSEKGYPDKPTLALKSFSAPLVDLKCSVKIKDLKPGRYAITVIHDADENGELNTNPLGYPVEGYGFSNNAKAYFSAPAFSKASFELGMERKTIVINLR